MKTAKQMRKELTENRTKRTNEFAVTAQAFQRETGEPIDEARTETIDISTNMIFLGATTILEIKAAYERWWNCLNPNSHAIVMVSRVQKI